MPLCPTAAMQGSLIKTLVPVFDIDGEPYAMLTPQLAEQVGSKVADLAGRRDEVMCKLPRQADRKR